MQLNHGSKGGKQVLLNKINIGEIFECKHDGVNIFFSTSEIDSNEKNNITAVT